MCSVILLAKTPKTAVNRGMYYNELRATYVHVSVTFASSIKYTIIHICRNLL